MCKHVAAVMILSQDSRGDRMKRFVEGVDREQASFFPECLEDWIAEENAVRVIEAFVEGLDLGALGFSRVAPKATGTISSVSRPTRPETRATRGSRSQAVNACAAQRTAVSEGITMAGPSRGTGAAGRTELTSGLSASSSPSIFSVARAASSRAQRAHCERIRARAPHEHRPPLNSSSRKGPSMTSRERASPRWAAG